MKKSRKLEFPSAEQLEAELRYERYRMRYVRVIRSTIFMLVVVAAFSVLAAMLWFPVLQIFGISMTPTLAEGDIVLAMRGDDIERGDIVAFYYGNKILVKRCIGLPGDVIEISEEGNVTVNGEPIEEPYVKEKSLGDSDISYPYTVDQERYFLVGDHRTTSIDSRNTSIGCISTDQIAGRVIFRLWPIKSMGKIEVSE